MAPEILNSFIGVGGSLLNSLIGGSVSQGYNERNMALQAQYAKELADYQWNKFQSPQAQIRGLTAAGLSPNVFTGGKGSNGVPSVGSMPSSAPVDMSGLVDIPALSQYMLSVAQAKKAGMDTKLSEQDIKNKEVERQRNDFELNLRKQFGKDISSAELANAYMQLVLASDQSDINELEKALKVYSIQSEKALAKANEHQRDILKQTLDNTPVKLKLENRIKEKQANMYQAQANEANASAFEHTQRGNLIISQKEEQDFYNLVRTDPDVRSSLIKQMRSFGVAAEKQNLLTSKQIELMDYSISQAAYADDMKEYSYWIDKVTSILTSAATVGGAAGLLKHYSHLDKALGKPKVSKTVHYNAFGEQDGRSVTTSE